MKKNLLAASVAAAVLAMTPVANAAWTTAATTLNVVSQAVSTTKDDAAAQAAVVYTLAAGESLTANDTIEIVLTGGLTFDGTTGVTLAPSAGDIGAGAATAAVPLSGGTAGSTSATWRVIAAVATASTLTLNSTGTIFDTNGVAVGNNADVLLTLKTGGGLTIGTASSSLNTTLESTSGANDAMLFTGVNLATPALTASTNTAQVSTGYVYLEDNATDVLTDAVVVNTQSNSAATSIPTAAIAAANLLYTLAGDFTGVTSVAATGVTGSDSAGSQTGGTAGAFTVDAANGVAYASNTAAVAAAGGSLNIADLVITLDGTTAQAARSFTITTQVLGDATWSAHDVQATATATAIARNGTFFTSNSTGALNNIKVTDQSGSLPTAGGDISYAAWDASGASVAQAAGAATLPATVPSNGTVIVPGADLTANFPGGVRYDVTVNSSDASISNVKKTATGTTVNTYRSGTGGAL